MARLIRRSTTTRLGRRDRISRAQIRRPEIMQQTNPVEIAISQVGVFEATGKNDGVPADRYNHGEAKAWCAAFVAWCFEQAGTPLPANIYKLASVEYMDRTMKNAGTWWPCDPQFP